MPNSCELNKTCGTCVHFISYMEIYEDPLEPDFCGECREPNIESKCVSEDTEACDKHKEEKE